MSVIDAFPLQWPQGFSRTKFRKRAAFKASFAQSRDGIMHELRLLGAKLPVLSTNVPLRRDGLPYAGGSELLPDPGVAVYFTLDGKQMSLACDLWVRVSDNLRAVELTISAMRGMDRWGVSDMLNRAFSGFAALPPPSDHWSDVLDINQHAGIDAIEEVYRAKMKRAHPDIGGSVEASQRLNKAISEARKARCGA